MAAARDRQALIDLGTATPTAGPRRSLSPLVIAGGTGAGLGLIAAVVTLPANVLPGFVLAALIAGVLLTLIGAGYSRLGLVLLLAFSLRAALALVNSHYDLVSERIAKDIFDTYGHEIALGWQSGQPVQFADIEEGIPVASYSYYIGAVYYVFGHHPSLILILNCLFDTLAIAAVMGLTKQLFDMRAGLWVGLIEALSPYTVWMCGTFLREAVSRMLLAVFLLTLVRWADRRQTKLGWAALWLGLASLLRPEILPTLVAVVGVAWLLGLRRSGEPRFGGRQIRRGIAVALPIVALAILFVFRYSEQLFRFGGGLSAEFFENFRQARTHGGSAYLEWVQYDNLLEVALFAPLRALYFLFVPLPWHVNSAGLAAAFLADTTVQVALALLAGLGLRALWRGRVTHPNKARLAVIVAAYLAIGAATYGVVEGNIGAALRHRRQFTFALSILAAPHLARLARRIRLADPSLESKAADPGGAAPIP